MMKSLARAAREGSQRAMGRLGARSETRWGCLLFCKLCLIFKIGIIPDRAGWLPASEAVAVRFVAGFGAETLNEATASKVRKSQGEGGGQVPERDSGRARSRPTERICFLDGIELTRPVDSPILPRLSRGLRAQW